MNYWDGTNWSESVLQFQFSARDYTKDWIFVARK
jgi:hypothetical protein